MLYIGCSGLRGITSYSLRCSGSSSHGWTLTHRWGRVCPPHCFWFQCCRVTPCHRIHQSLSLVLGSGDKDMYHRDRNIHAFALVPLSQSRPSARDGGQSWLSDSSLSMSALSDQNKGLAYHKLCFSVIMGIRALWILRLKQRKIKLEEGWYFWLPGACDPGPLDLRTMAIKRAEGGTREPISFPFWGILLVLILNFLCQ